MIICQQCQKTQLEGSIFCTECGAKLRNVSGTVTQSFVPNPELLKFVGAQENSSGELVQEPEPKIILHILKSGEQLSLSGQEDFTIGRSSEGQSIIPDVDLSPYNAYQEGVSRIHAAFKITGNQVNLIDLSSVNGTTVNDSKITPNVYHPLQSGDMITLGRLKIQVLLRV